METRAVKRRRMATEAAAQKITAMLPVDLLTDLFGTFLGPGHYRYVAGTCRAFRNAYQSAIPGRKEKNTTWESAVASVACAEICLSEAPKYVSDDIALASSRMGRIDVIEWCVNRGYSCTRDLFIEAGKCGQLAVFEWGLAEGDRWCHSSAAASSAAAHGHENVLEWIREHAIDRWTFTHCDTQAAMGGFVSVLDWLTRHGLPLKDIKPCWLIAATYGHINVLNWLRDNGHNVYPGIMAGAAWFGQPSVIQWAVEHQVGWSRTTCALAAYTGHLNALKCLRRNGCPWDGSVIYWAQHGGHSNVVEWARENDCPAPVAGHTYSISFPLEL